MASLNEILTGTLGNILTKRLGMQTGASAPTLAPEVMPVLALESDRPEWKWLGNERLSVSRWSVNPAVGAYSTCRLLNPANSGVLVVVELVVAFGTGIRIGINPPASTGTGPFASQRATVSRDTRQVPIAPTTNTTATVSVDNTLIAYPAGSVDAAIWYPSTGLPMQLSLPFILMPGTALDVSSSGTNSGHEGFLAWRERPLVPGELVP